MPGPNDPPGVDDPELLEELRAVFLDELADWLGTLEREVVALRRTESTPDDLKRSLLEIRRAAHTLKGAARVVGHRDLERTCHQLESELPRADTPFDRAAAHATANRALADLQAWSDQHAPAPATPAPSATTTTTAPTPAPVPEAGTVRVSSARVSEISTLSEEILIAAGRAHRGGTDLDAFEQAISELRRALGKLSNTHRDPSIVVARAAVERLSSLTLQRRREEAAHWQDVCSKASALTAGTRALRATRFDVLQATLERAVQETASDVGKQVSLQFHGGDAELDRRIVDRLREPLVHLLRNAVDHGIESHARRSAAGKPAVGTITVEARAVGTDILLTIEDDGRGIDVARLADAAAARGIDPTDEPAVLELLFEPGVTTRQVATATSGRGIGLDVVRQRISELQGRLRVAPNRGTGARFSIVVPGDLSVARALVVQVRDRPYVLVETSVERGLRVRTEHVRLLEGRSYVLIDGTLLPMVEAGRLLGLGRETHEHAEAHPAVVLGAGERRVVFAVDAFRDMREVVIKPLGPRVRRAAFVTGATILGDGELACVLDSAAIARHGRAGSRREEGAPAAEVRTVLVVDDSVTTRQLLVSILQSAGLLVETASDGEQAWRRIVSGRPPALVVSDIEMPNVDGFQLLARIKGSPETSGVPVVLVTALSRDEDKRRALELGADAYVVKGRFDQAALLETVEELLP